MSRTNILIIIVVAIVAGLLVPLPTLAQEVTATPVPPVVEPPVIVVPPDNPEILAIGVGVVAIVLALVAIFRGTPADKAITLQLELIQSNREAMNAYERQYGKATEQVRYAFDALTSIVKAIAPLTPITADDKLAGLLEDVQRVGVDDGDTQSAPPTFG